MPTQKKIETVEALRERIQRSALTIATDIRGLRVKEIEQVRRRFKAADIEFKVVKNTLLRLAAQAADQPDLMGVVEGPTALAFAYGNIVEAAKAASELSTPPGQLTVRGAFLDGQVISADDLKDLARLPPKPVLVAQVAGQLQGPLVALVTLLQGPMQGFSYSLQALLGQLPNLIEARARQLESSQQPS